jgi:hypothetical protein
MPPGTSLSSNAMDASRKKDPAIAASARGWAEAAWRAWHDGGRAGAPPTLDAGRAHEALGLDSKLRLAELVGYSGGCHGGDHLATWTFGHALHVLVLRSPAPGTRPVAHGPFSVRTRVAAGATSPPS